MRILIVFFSLLNICLNIYAQPSTTDSSLLGVGHIISIKSRYVKDETYIIKIHLPANFETSGKKYPVLYLLDGDRSYGMASDLSEWLRSTGEIDQFIIVGICYGESVTDRPRRQIRDFTPSRDPTRKEPEYANAGGAKDFQLFIQKELMPIIVERYPTSERTVIVGFEYGALFSAFILISNSKAFSDYVLISPLLLWDSQYLFKIEKAF
ncbi:MAG TPA: alpha/beta hydrolase-fold protein, partial [Bacteroidales bacterium]|nr:alpha/beta hydrolase-fold protein [Bacteroidales bacterium]